MNPIRDDISNWLRSAESLPEKTALEPRMEHVGSVERVGDGVATVVGLPWTRLDELLRFADGTLGLALRVSEDSLDCALLGNDDGISAGQPVYGTGGTVRVPVGEELLGRVVDAMGAPIDDGDAINPERLDPIERPAPPIIDRDFVSKPLMTGITVIDSMIPLGRGQRELIIGDRKTGKTAIAVDAIINQRDTDVICIYAAIGQKTSTVNRIVENVRQHGAPERCVFVVSLPESAPGAQWVTPYSACTIAEYFRDKGRDVLLVFDDLSKHAIIYRQLSLLLRKPPGREAYPGDIFYLHARLLERAAKLSSELGGGSLTALPIAETQEGNLTAYIPTNLISITDGQIYLEPKLFYEGQRPAVNVSMSVSRVGGKTQAPAMKQIAERLKLEYAQFLELEVFTRFGALVDERTSRTIAHGRRIRAMLVQPEFEPLDLAGQIALLLAVEQGLLDSLSLDQVNLVKSQLGDWLANNCAVVIAQIDKDGTLNDDQRQELIGALTTLTKQVAQSPADSD